MMRKSDLFADAMHEALTSGALVRFRAEGTSMYPTIRDGEVVTIAPIACGEIVRGDVLMCRHSERFLTHRVVAVNDFTGCDGDRVFHLRGDAKAACDAPVAAVNVVGRVISVDRNGRVIPMSGRAARLRHRARATASRARTGFGNWLMLVCVPVGFFGS